MKPGTSDRFAAIDMGTNSFHLAIVETGSSGQFEILTTEKEMVRLGTGAGDLNTILPDAMDRGVSALKRFASIAHSFHARIRAVATSAVREANNKDEFLERVKRDCQIDVEVISGLEEARLIYLGILQGLSVYDKKILMIDIGGGSTEFLIGFRGQPLLRKSFKLGAIRLSDRFFMEDPISSTNIEDCRKFLTVQFAGTLDDFESETTELVVGSSGTIETIYEMIQLRKNQNQLTEDPSIFSADLNEIVEIILSKKSTKDRAALSGLDKKRADIITGGAVLLQEIFKKLNIKKMIVSPFALREGVIIDTQLRETNLQVDFEQIRSQSVRKLMDRHLGKFRGEIDSALRALRYCETIFIQLKALGFLQNISDRDLELLKYSALLHNIGIHIAYSAHHKHSYYLIKNSEVLTGFLPLEREIMALISRYHRKASPSKKHQEYMALSEQDRFRVQALSAIMRFAVALDRGRRKNHNLSFSRNGESIEIVISSDELFPSENENDSLELWSVEMNRSYLEEVLNSKIRVSLSHK